MNKKFQLRSLLGLLLLAALYSAAVAQTSRGTLTGTVIDNSGAVVANATVKITEGATGATRQSSTNDAGIYRFDAVELGVYTVVVQAKGFGSQTQTGVDVEKGRKNPKSIFLQMW